MDCLIYSSCRMHKWFTPTEIHTRFCSHRELKAALVLFPATKQDSSSLTCDWKCSEQTLPIRATSYQTQSGAQVQSVQTPCAKVAHRARGFPAQDVRCLRQCLIPGDQPKSRGSYILALSAGLTIINSMWFSAQSDTAPRPQTCPLINQTSVGFTARGRGLQCGNWRGKNISHLSARETCTAHAGSLAAARATSPVGGREQSERERVVSFVSSPPVVITRMILDLIDLLIPWSALWLQLRAYVINHWPWNPEMGSSLGPAVSQLLF